MLRQRRHVHRTWPARLRGGLNRYCRPRVRHPGRRFPCLPPGAGGLPKPCDKSTLRRLRLARGTVAVAHGNAGFSAPRVDAMVQGQLALLAATVDRWTAGGRGDVRRPIHRRHCAHAANPLVRTGRRHQAGAASPRLGRFRPRPPSRAAASDAVRLIAKFGLVGGNYVHFFNATLG